MHTLTSWQYFLSKKVHNHYRIRTMCIYVLLTRYNFKLYSLLAFLLKKKSIVIVHKLLFKLLIWYLENRFLVSLQKVKVFISWFYLPIKMKIRTKDFIVNVVELICTLDTSTYVRNHELRSEVKGVDEIWYCGTRCGRGPNFETSHFTCIVLI